MISMWANDLMMMARLPPVNVIIPAITPAGTATRGTMLTVAPGTWSGATAYLYQWYLGALPIIGAITNTLDTSALLPGSVVKAQVVGVNLLTLQSTAESQTVTIT